MYVTLTSLNSVSSQYKFETRLLVIDGNGLIIDGGWLDFECMYRMVFFGFLIRNYFPVFRLKDTSKKSVVMRLVSIVIDSPLSLNKLIMPFPNLSSFGKFSLCTMASPSSLYNSTLQNPREIWSYLEGTLQQVLTPLHCQSFPLWHGITIFHLFIPKLCYYQITKIFLHGVWC